MNIKSIHFKITLWYTLMLASTLSLFSMLLYHNFDKSLKINMDVLLHSRAEGISDSIETYWETEKLEAIQDGVIIQNLNKTDNINFQKIVQRRIEEKNEDPRLLGIIMQVFDRNGKFIASSKNISGITTLPKETLDYALSGKNKFDNVEIESVANKSIELRTLTMPVLENNKVTYIVRVGSPLNSISSVLKSLKMLLFLLLPLMVSLTGTVGLFLAKLAMNPVGRVIKTIHQITAENLKLRINIPDTKDEIKKLADTFNEMISRLERSFSTQRQLIEDLSHELKTPLAIMNGEIEVTLKKTRSIKEYEATLRSELEEINRIARIVENLLTLAKFESNTIILDIKQVEISELIKNAVNEISVLADRKKIKITVSPEKTAALINGDENQLRRLFLNLLDNAIKNTPKDGDVTINISNEKNLVKIRVSDTGIGINKDDIIRIFDRFYRADKSRGSEGFGLGLSISKSIVSAHKGKIEVDSQPGKGAAFTVLLPKHNHS